MKNLIMSALLFSSMTAFAYDMSRTQTWESSYKELPDGSSQYVGKCSVHQEYEGKFFVNVKTIIPYFAPEYNASEQSILKKLNKLEPELIKTVLSDLTTDSFRSIDDLTVEKIQSTRFLNLDLYRFNIGVGGGNGLFVIYNRTKRNNIIRYEKMAEIMDGDVEYCDHLVWLK